MKKEEVEQIVENSANRFFGLMKEWLDDRFRTIDERFIALENKMDRGFKELRADIKENRDITNEHSIAIVNLNSRVTKLEKKII